MNFLEKLDESQVEENLDNDLRVPWKTYLNEAHWGWNLISKEIELLESDSQVLELGSGPQMLSGQVASTGVKLTSIEPASQGFSVMESLGEIVRKFSLKERISYKFLSTTGEDFLEENQFDFAFSINVMEHVIDIYGVLTNIFNSLKPGGRYHFICPNYSFPYEPHFNSLTLVNKRATDKLLKSRLVGKSKHNDSEGMWNSLNWINHGSINSWATGKNNLEITFSRRALNLYITRAVEDHVFQVRHPLLSRLTRFLKPLIILGMALTPIRFLPILDVTVVKSEITDANH